MERSKYINHVIKPKIHQFSGSRCVHMEKDAYAYLRACLCTQGRRHVMLWGAMALPKFFKTSIIVGRNRSHTFSFKSWPPYEKKLAPPPIRSHKNAPPQILTFPLFYFYFPSLRHVSHIPYFFLSWVRPYPIAIQRHWCRNYH